LAGFNYEIMKRCSKCKRKKSKIEFYKNRSKRDGYSCDCKDCRRKYQQTEEYKERHKKYAKRYYQQNPQEVKKRTKKWEQSKKGKEWAKKYRQTEKRKRYNKEFQRYRNKNPKNRIDNSISSGIYDSLKKNKNCKSWETLVGYTLIELQKHLEKQFEPWMNWENYGKWHIDHIRPISSFNFTSAEDPKFKKCWALENLQPLEAIENIKKSNH
jgi:hypothetical protein